MKSFHIYLSYNGTTEAAFNFYRSVIGGEVGEIHRYDAMPGNESVPTADRKKIMHMRLTLPNNFILMGSDALESMGKSIQPGTNFHLNIQAASRDEADKLFQGLSLNGKVIMPMADQFWGDYFGMFIDQFGIHWMVNFGPAVG